MADVSTKLAQYWRVLRAKPVGRQACRDGDPLGNFIRLKVQRRRQCTTGNDRRNDEPFFCRLTTARSHFEPFCHSLNSTAGATGRRKESLSRSGTLMTGGSLITHGTL
jgi:hypothetical protein